MSKIIVCCSTRKHQRGFILTNYCEGKMRPQTLDEAKQLTLQWQVCNTVCNMINGTNANN